jgi:succinate-semialdehyde dehydrogenase/glutarate-semialdehyde dehydrogenase
VAIRTGAANRPGPARLLVGEGRLARAPAGTRLASCSDMSASTLTAIDPCTGLTLATYEADSPEQVQDALHGARRAFSEWRQTPISQRAQLFRHVAEELRDEVAELAELMAREMGKPVRQGRAEVEKCAWVCEHYAARGEEMLAPQRIQTEASRSYVTFEPLGVILAVMPWNFPLWQVFRAATPALMAGNAMVLKHASNVPGCARAIESLFIEAGFPDRLFRTLLVGSDAVGSLIAAPEIAAVTLTGSTDAGGAVASQAGAVRKKCVLELGGSDAYVILADADLEAAAAACAESRLLNAGQSCISAKRFVVVEEVREEFTRRMTERMAATRVGGPLSEDTQLGPLARADLRDDLHRQVSESVAAGAEILIGGDIPPGDGAFYPPTVLANVEPGMPAHDEELFGPVAAIIAADDEQAAIAAANNSRFGLGAAVFTRDRARGEEIAAHRLEAGFCAVNDYVRSDPRLPFGGIKDSGFGRELGHFGIQEMVNIKTVYVK